MAQDPERDDERSGESAVNPSADLDMVTLFSSSAIDAEMEANGIHMLLQANGVESVVVGPSVIPSLEFQLQVPRARVEEAKRLLEEARAAGPAAAEEAEAASERPQEGQ
jgi:hypothetical protein